MSKLKRFRSAITGRFVKPATARRHPRATVAETAGDPRRQNDVTTFLVPAPWTDEQVTALNEHQAHGGTHGLTCGAHTSTLLVAHADGWRCPTDGCRWRMNWCHAFQLGYEPAPEASETRTK